MAAMHSDGVFLTGGSGFVGTHVLRELVRREFTVRALVRHPGSLRYTHPLIREIPGDILQPDTLLSALEGCSAILHLVGIITEKKPNATFRNIHVIGTGNLVTAALAGGIQRFIHMSALGSRPDAHTAYHQTKWEAEQIVRTVPTKAPQDTAFAWTIFRPSLIHGPDGEFSQMLRGWSLGRQPPFFFMPYFGTGALGQTNSARIAPVFVDDVAYLIVDALTNDNSHNQTYSVVGPHTYTWPEMLQLASAAFRGRPKNTLGIPLWLARFLTALPLPLPFNRDQVFMSLEDSVADPAPVFATFPDLQLHDFPNTLEAYKNQMTP